MNDAKENEAKTYAGEGFGLALLDGGLSGHANVLVRLNEQAKKSLLRVPCLGLV